jgi:dipeptidyl aminopeptidase/acylaminoacyl peptidase
MGWYHRFLTAIFAMLLAAITAAPAMATPAAHQNPAVGQAIQAMFGVHEIEQTVISPDGRRVAWVETLTGKNGAPTGNSAIYVASVKAPAKRVRVTAARTGTASEGDIAWSPDSHRLAFLSDAAHPGQKQLYVSTPGGAARQLTHLKGNLSDPTFSPDGKTIALLSIANAPPAVGPLAAEPKQTGVIGSKILEQRLTLVGVSTAHVRQVSPPHLYVYEYDWAPDGKHLAATAAQGRGDDNWWVAQLYVFDPAIGSAKLICKPPVTLQMADPQWSPDGRSIAFIGGLMSDEAVVGGDIYTVPADGGEPRDVTDGMKATASSIAWSEDSQSMVFGEFVDGKSGIARVHIDSGAITTLWTGGEHLGANMFGIGVSLSRDGKVSAAVRQSYARPPEVWAGPIGQWKQVTRLNRGLRPAWGETKSLHWKTDIGPVQGWVVYPRDYDPAKRYPMVVNVHGGPAWANLSSWPTRWDYEAALPAAGYFLLLPNPRGSYGAGEAYTRANVKDFGGGDFRDILAGVDEAIKTLPIDPQRLGITGWSYGGYMTMWAVTQTHRFHAAVAGAGLADWLSYYGENQIDKWMIPYFGASVYNDPAVYAKSAPIHFVKNVKTPTLIVVGDSDGECPTPQSYEFWHALKTLDVPTQLVVYPNEGHMFADPAHSRDVIRRTVAWFDSRL